MVLSSHLWAKQFDHDQFEETSYAQIEQRPDLLSYLSKRIQFTVYFQYAPECIPLIIQRQYSN